MFGAFSFGQPSFGEVSVATTPPPPPHPPQLVEIPAGGGYWNRQRKREEERRKKRRKASLSFEFEPISFSGHARVYWPRRKANLSACLMVKLTARGKVRCKGHLAAKLQPIELHAHGRRHWKDATDAVLTMALAACD